MIGGGGVRSLFGRYTWKFFNVYDLLLIVGLCLGPAKSFCDNP